MLTIFLSLGCVLKPIGAVYPGWPLALQASLMRHLAREYSLEARPRMESMAAAAARLSLLQAAAASAHDGGRDVAYTAALALSGVTAAR